MKTIEQVHRELKRAGLKLEEKESTWAESKSWWSRGGGLTHADVREILREAKANAGRHMRVEFKDKKWDGFEGVCVSFAKNRKAREMVDQGLDPGDLENEIWD